MTDDKRQPIPELANVSDPPPVDPIAANAAKAAAIWQQSHAPDISQPRVQQDVSVIPSWVQTHERDDEGNTVRLIMAWPYSGDAA